MTSATERRELLKTVYEEARGCVSCALHQTRTTVVFGSGNADADLMFIGEAPGANEDKLGLPFVGQAGKLLDKLLIEIGLNRADVFIANTVKCRPPNNRDPHPHEIESCNGYLRRQVFNRPDHPIEIIRVELPARQRVTPVSYTHLTLPTTPYV